MSKRDADAVSAIAAIGGAVVALHGVTSRNWTYAHTFFLALALIGAIATLETA